MIRKIDKNLIKEVIIFDSYEGNKIDKNFKAVALSVKIQSDNKTLQDTEINELSKKLFPLSQRNLMQNNGKNYGKKYKKFFNYCSH